MHGFCDASQRAYASVIYLCIVYSDGSVHLSFVSSKPQVSQVKAQTIPRSELLGAVILAQLMDAVYTALKSCFFNFRMFY